MGKQRQFDENKVLSLIAEHFWEHGYAATKVDQLAALTGLTKTSLYNAFGNKEALFLKTLNVYVAQSFSDLFQQLDTNKRMSDNLELLLTKFFVEVDSRELSYGCLVINSILEFAANEPNLYFESTERHRAVRNTLYSFFDLYVQQDRLTPDMSADDLTVLFSIFYQGLRVQARIAQSEEALQRAIKSFLYLQIQSLL